MSYTGWWIGYGIGILVVLVVVALVTPILLLARSIGKAAPLINDQLGAEHRAAEGPEHHHRARHAHHRRAEARPGKAGRLGMEPHVLALSSGQHTAWTIGLIVGFVVILAVVALLSLLIYLVKIIDRRVVEVRDTLTTAVANTEATSLLPVVAGGVEAVLAEGLQHHLFLGRVLGKVKS
jgi:uncharacterized membrane protein